MSVRAFPAPKHKPPAGWEGAWCRWCGDKIVHGRKDRTAHDGRADEPNCRREHHLHTDRDLQYRVIAERDGEKCWGCGELSLKVVRGREVYIGGVPGTWWTDPHDRRIGWMCGSRYTDVTIKPALEVEHSVPLWSVAHLPDDERRKFFGPDYLRLYGPCCHKPKTRAEAKQRAKVKRLADRREAPAEVVPFRITKRKPKMQSRPFPKGPKRKIVSRGFR